MAKIKIALYMLYVLTVNVAAHANPLNTELFLLETSFSLYMPLTHRISIPVQALTPKLNLSQLPTLTNRLVTLTMPTQ